jgi:hypothetical protein
VRARDLTDEDIGRSFIVPDSTNRGKKRICFEGVTRRPQDVLADSGGDTPYWMILVCSPIPGVLSFRTPSGKVFTGVLVRSNSQIWPLEVDWAVTADGEIVELAVRAA